MLPIDAVDAASAGPLVLVVDDYPDALAMYGLRLRQAGFSVAFACEEDEAVEKARALRPIVIVMDLALRVGDGWSATRSIKGDASMRSMPVIAVSAHVTPEYINAAYDAGCDLFVPKPCTPDALVAHVKRMAGGSAPH